MSFHDLIGRLNPWWASPAARPQTERERRPVFETLRQRLEDADTGRAQVLLGPRRVGKSTTLRQIAAHFLDGGWPSTNLTYFDFKDDRSEVRPLEDVVQARPAGFREDCPRLLLLDEVTRAPRWDLALKRLVDEARATSPSKRSRILATDSAASLVRSGAKESLEGRVDELVIHPLSFKEALRFQGEGESERDTFANLPGVFERYLASGGMPEHVVNRDLELAWERIRGDVADKAIARDLEREGVDVERATALYRVIVQNSGALFDAAKRAQDLRTEDLPTDERTVRRWVELFEQACLLGRHAPWHPGLHSKAGKQSRALRTRSKLYAEDHGFIPAFSPLPAPMTNADVRARVFETVVFNHLRGLRDDRRDFRLGFFREDDDLEIDFVLDFGGTAIGIEVTSSRAPEKKVARLARFPDRVHLKHVTVVHGGPLQIKDAEPVSCWPIDGFLLDPQDCVERSLQWARKSR